MLVPLIFNGCALRCMYHHLLSVNWQQWLVILSRLHAPSATVITLVHPKNFGHNLCFVLFCCSLVSIYFTDIQYYFTGCGVIIWHPNASETNLNDVGKWMTCIHKPNWGITKPKQVMHNKRVGIFDGMHCFIHWNHHRRSKQLFHWVKKLGWHFKLYFMFDMWLNNCYISC